jgi:hypothetical protein
VVVKGGGWDGKGDEGHGEGGRGRRTGIVYAGGQGGHAHEADYGTDDDEDAEGGDGDEGGFLGWGKYEWDCGSC